VGAGNVGEPKIRSLLDAGAKVRVIAPSATDAVVEWARAGLITWEQRTFEASDLNGIFLTIAATASTSVNDLVFREARRRGVLCNAVDDPERCDFYYPAVVRRGQLQIAISTGGQSPALAQRLRRELETEFGEEYSEWVQELGTAREKLLNSDLDSDHRKQILHSLASRGAFDARRSERADERRNFVSGKVYLVGAGPGDPDLLTLKALKILKRADVVLHDDLIPLQILDLVPRAAQLRNVGKRCGRKSISQDEINALLVTFASFGLQVVRLKGGDPLIFGRGGEEIEALRKAKIDFEIVPGVTAALGAAAAAQIPLTHRKLSSAVVFLTAHQANTGYAKDWHQMISSGATLVIYMPGNHYDATSKSLLEAGLAATTPCAIISQATRPNQRIYQTTIGKLPTTARHASPTLLIVGEVAQLGVGDRDAREEFELRIRPYVGEATIPLYEIFGEGSRTISIQGETE